MIFSSLIFLFWFLPIFFAVYLIVPNKFKNAVLFLGSIIFYGFGEPKFLILIFVSILVNYVSGLLIDRFKAYKKLFFILCLLFDFGMLFVFKYVDFFISNTNSLLKLNIPLCELTLPLGISFYTFQIASYIIDLYRGKITVEKNILNLGTYLVMFPQLIAGPILVYSNVSKELHERKVSINDIFEGLTTFVIGLSSKILIANQVGKLWDELDTIGYGNISMPLAWMGVIAFTLQIYFDFNGYSLMAIGLGRMMGFNISRNFNHPYISRSITEFWRRWHITLSSWFKEYLYIPLGGSKKGKGRTILNLFIVWFVTGFWHGAGWNFILWGLFFFVVLVIEKQFLKSFLDSHPIFARVYSLVLIGLSWMIFAITDMDKLGTFFAKLFSFDFGTDIAYYGRNYGVVILLGCIFSTPVISKWFEKIKGKWAGNIITLVLFALCVAYLADAAYNPFLYFRF